MQKASSASRFFFVALSLFLIWNSGCNNSSRSISLHEADSLISVRDLYALPYERFSGSLDSILLQLSKDDREAGYYFAKMARYGYPLNHCLSKHDTAFEYVKGLEHLITREDLNREKLTRHAWYRDFLRGYLDLSAKYHIEGGNATYHDHMFMQMQLEIAGKHLEGAALETALFGLAEQQIREYGPEFSGEMVRALESACSDEKKLTEIKEMEAELLNALDGAEEFIYRVDGQDTLSAFVFQPERQNETEPNPCIVIAHGGGWYLGHPLQRNHIPRHFNELGITSVSIEYRIKGRTDADPVTGLKDLKAAIRWVRQHAGELGIDPNQIIASGLSAGGHLAAAAALIDGFEHAGENRSVSSRPDAVILWSGCVDPTVDNWFRWCMGRLTDERALSPLHNVKTGAPPFLVFQGTNDEFLEHASHIAFRDSMEAKGNLCKLILFEGLTHTQIYEQDMAAAYEEFLASVF